jgi:hypothetical protein
MVSGGGSEMQMSVKAATITSSTIWGGALLTVGIINLAKPKCGREFLKMIASVYLAPERSGTCKPF